MAKKTKPTVLSIIVPSYNQGQFIAKTLDEPARYPEVELIVMDGGSTDETVSVLEERDRLIDYWVSTRDNGQADAINRGFNRATGDWVAFQNSDDFYLDGAIRLVLDTIRKYPDADMIVGGTQFTDAEGRPYQSTLPKPLWRLPHARLNFIHNQALFVRRTFAERAGWLRSDAQFCLDYEWFLRLLRNRPKIRLINAYIGAQRMHEDTKTSQNQLVHDAEFEKFSKMHFRPWERAAGRVVLPIYRGFRLIYRSLPRKMAG